MTSTRNLILSHSRMAGLILLAVACTSIFAMAQQRQTLGRIEFVGLKRLTREQVTTMSGLKPGQVIDASILDAAAGELLNTDYFAA